MFELVINKRLNCFLSKPNIIRYGQYGFHKDISAEKGLFRIKYKIEADNKMNSVLKILEKLLMAYNEVYCFED